MADERLPRVVREGKIKVEGLEITVCVLDDGRRIIPEEDFKKALDFLGITKEDLDLFNLMQRTKQ